MQDKPAPEQVDAIRQTVDREYFDKLRKLVQNDDESRKFWLNRQADFLIRRFAVEGPNKRFPWPGASTITMPTIDTTMDRLHSSYVQSTLGVDPAVIVQGLNRESMKNEASVQRRLKHMIDVRIPDFEKEVGLAADLRLQHGWVMLYVHYDYRTRLIDDVLHRNRLPGPLAHIIAGEPVDEDMANAVFKHTGRALLSQQTLRDNSQALRLGIRVHFGLDASDPLDAKNEGLILDWLLKGKTDTLVIKRREVYRDTPRVRAILPEDFIIHASAGWDQDSWRRATVRDHVTIEEVNQRARDEGWDPAAMRDLREHVERGTRTGSEIDTLAIARNFAYYNAPDWRPPMGRDRGLIEINTTFCYRDLDGDGEPARLRVIWTPSVDRPLLVTRIPYKFAGLPFEQIRREHTDRAFYHTRGIPEILDPLDKEITEQHRAKLNNMAISTSLTFKARINSGLAGSMTGWIPGSVMWVQRMEDIEPFQMPNSQLSFEREEQALTGWVERRARIFDQSLAEQGNLTRPRTAAEITGVTSLQEQATGADLLLWHKGWARVWYMLWALDEQFGPEELDIRVAGLDEPLHQTRHEIQGRFNFLPSPAALVSPTLRLQQAQLQANLLVQAAQSKIDFGDEYEVNVGEAFRQILEMINPRTVDRIVRRRTPDEIRQIQQQKAAQQSNALTLPPQAFEGPVNQAGQRAASAESLGVPIQSSGVGGFV